MERHERQEDAQARGTLAAGFYIVRDGTVRPDDLVWSWSSKEWIRADDPSWLQPSPINVADCVAVARSAAFREPGFEDARRRTYTIPTIATPEPALIAGVDQGSLF
jgi:hypothetical protein